MESGHLFHTSGQCYKTSDAALSLKLSLREDRSHLNGDAGSGSNLSPLLSGMDNFSFLPLISFPHSTLIVFAPFSGGGFRKTILLLVILSIVS